MLKEVVENLLVTAGCTRTWSLYHRPNCNYWNIQQSWINASNNQAWNGGTAITKLLLSIHKNHNMHKLPFFSLKLLSLFLSHISSRDIHFTYIPVCQTNHAIKFCSVWSTNILQKYAKPWSLRTVWRVLLGIKTSISYCDNEGKEYHFAVMLPSFLLTASYREHIQPVPIDLDFLVVSQSAMLCSFSIL